MKPDIPAAGGCRCDRVRFRISATPLFTMVCHCRGCQRMSGSVFSTNVAVPSAAFEVTTGETAIGGLHGEQSHHHHCPWCLSWLFTTMSPDPGFVIIRATMLDDSSWFAPFVATCTDEALPWALTPARHSFPGFPPPSSYPELLAEFASL